MFRLLGWGSGKKDSRSNNLDDELESNLTLARSHSARSYKSTRSQISISAPIPRNYGPTSLNGLDSDPYLAGSPASGSANDLRQFRHPNTSLSRLGPYGNHPAGSSSLSVGRLPLSHDGRSPQPHFSPYDLPSPPLSDVGSDVVSLSSINDGPPPAVIRIETNTRLPARKTLQPAPTRGASSATHQPITIPSAPMGMQRTVSSPPSSASPYHHSPAEGSTSSSSELTPTFPGGAASGSNGGRWPLKLNTANPIYSQSMQSLPSSSAPGASQFHSAGMHSDPSLAYSEGNADAFSHAYSYPLVTQLSPIAEQEYLSPDSIMRPKELPPSSPASRVGLDLDFRGSADMSNRGSLRTHSGSPVGSQMSEITRPSPIYASPFISRPLNRTNSQGSSRTHVSPTPSILAPRSSKSDSHSNSQSIPPLDVRSSTLGTNAGGMQPSPTGSGRVRTSKFSNPMPSIIGSTEGGYEEDEYGGMTDRESLHAESFVTASGSEDNVRPGQRREDSARYIETVDKQFIPASGPPQASSVRSGVSRVMPPSASESFITRRWDRDAALAPGVTTFRAKKQWINVTPAFWAFWFGFLCPFLWLVGGWHFTRFGEQPPRLTVWEFYFACCGGKRRKEEVDHMKKEGKKAAVEPPPLPRWVSEKQSSELGRARLNDPKRSLKGISFGYPFISRAKQPSPEEQTVFSKIVGRLLKIMGKPNRIFDQLYGIKLREVRGRPESSRRMFDPWIQRCRYALCYAMLLLAIGLLSASAYLIVYNTRQL